MSWMILFRCSSFASGSKHSDTHAPQDEVELQSYVDDMQVEPQQSPPSHSHSTLLFTSSQKLSPIQSPIQLLGVVFGVVAVVDVVEIVVVVA